MADNNDSFDEFLNRAEEDYDAGDIEAAEAGDEDDVLNDVEGGEDESRPGAFVSEENKARARTRTAPSSKAPTAARAPSCAPPTSARRCRRRSWNTP